VEKVTLVGHDINSIGLNMTEPRIAEDIALRKPEPLKELI